MSTLIQSIVEQANQPVDPFEEIPLILSSIPEEQVLDDFRRQLKRAEAQKASVSWVIDTLNRNYKEIFTSSPAPGYISFNGTTAYDSASMSPADRDLATRAAARYNKYVAEIAALQKKIKKQEKLATAAKNAASVAGNAPAAPGQFSVGQIPVVIPNGRKGIDNPFFKHVGPAAGRYAGHPSGYTFSAPMRRMYLAFEIMLKRHGQTLDKLYVGRVQGAYINFVATSSNGKFVWYKYDMGGGSGQNHVFLNGTKMKSSELMAKSSIQQDAELKNNGVV